MWHKILTGDLVASYHLFHNSTRLNIIKQYFAQYVTGISKQTTLYNMNRHLL